MAVFPLIIGRGLTVKAREALGLAPSTLFRLPTQPANSGKGFSLAQKMVGRACGLPEGQGVRPGTYCEPEDDLGRLARHHRPDDLLKSESIPIAPVHFLMLG